MPVEIRIATPRDLPRLKPLVESAYRGAAARAGWTHEADLIEGERIAAEALAALVKAPNGRILVACDGAALHGCVNIADLGAGLAYLGLLCVDPQRQAAGLGKAIIAAAEALAAEAFGARRIEMTVIDRRAELIAYYERRGYRASGERRPFPIALDPPLGMVVLVKSLEPAQ
jgi:GNAT superfamily N-acetyltransferase